MASKMNALVNRGAPRDFLDVFEVVSRGLLEGGECWDLWQRKNPGGSMAQAKGDVIAALERIEQRRPLDIVAWRGSAITRRRSDGGFETSSRRRRAKMPYIDHYVYPDREEAEGLKQEFTDDAHRADYIARICGAWDFDIRPEPATFEFLKGWKDDFDRFPLPHSPAYHAFRTLFGWEQVARKGGGFIVPRYVILDRREGRTDPCEHLV